MVYIINKDKLLQYFEDNKLYTLTTNYGRVIKQYCLTAINDEQLHYLACDIYYHSSEKSLKNFITYTNNDIDNIKYVYIAIKNEVAEKVVDMI